MAARIRSRSTTVGFAAVRCVERVALHEVVPSSEGPSNPRLSQLKGAENSGVSLEVKRAASLWLAGAEKSAIGQNHANWQAISNPLLLPYWSAGQSPLSRPGDAAD
jgi:hypothetical protein